MPELGTFKSAPLGKEIVWNISDDSGRTHRWSTTVEFPKMCVTVEVLVPAVSNRRSKIEIVDRAIRNLETRFESNISKILQWYERQCPDRDPQTFENQLMKSATFLLDFTLEPAKREWIFWETHLQYLGVPVSTRGNVA